jgi:hypothetical protein
LYTERRASAADSSSAPISELEAAAGLRVGFAAAGWVARPLLRVAFVVLMRGSLNIGTLMGADVHCLRCRTNAHRMRARNGAALPRFRRSAGDAGRLFPIARVRGQA